jgi:hypothetical protein
VNQEIAAQQERLNQWRGNLARAWGRRLGYRCNGGGWIYQYTVEGYQLGSRPVCQGWASLYDRRYRKIWEWVEFSHVR